MRYEGNVKLWRPNNYEFQRLVTLLINILLSKILLFLQLPKYVNILSLT